MVGTLPTCAPEGCSFSVHETKMLVVRRVELITFKTVCIGNKTRREHFAPARITDVQSISGGEDSC